MLATRPMYLIHHHITLDELNMQQHLYKQSKKKLARETSIETKYEFLGLILILNLILFKMIIQFLLKF